VGVIQDFYFVSLYQVYLVSRIVTLPLPPPLEGGGNLKVLSDFAEVSCLESLTFTFLRHKISSTYHDVARQSQQPTERHRERIAYLFVGA